MSKSPYILSSLKEEPESNINNKKTIKNENSGVNKNFISKKSIKLSLDIKDRNRKKSPMQINNISSPVDLCLNALDNLPKQRNNECLKHIIYYLKSLPNFMNIISKEKNMKLSENLIHQISIHLLHEYIPKNHLICRYGEKGEKFYIILKGKVIFVVPKPSKCYLNLEEYITYLMQLRKNKEFELIKTLLVQNRIFYPIEDDNFDQYIIKEYEEYQKYFNLDSRKNIKSRTKIMPNRIINNRLITLNNERKEIAMPTIRNINIENIQNKLNGEDGNAGNDKNQKKFFSVVTYKKMEEIIEIIKRPKLVFNDDIFMDNSPKNYIKSNNVINTKLQEKDRKLVNIFIYEEMSIFEDGQTFGFIALQSKNSKRAATAIALENCDLGVLTKDEYIEFFEIISNREKKNLYELLKFINLITTVSEYKFIKKYYHMFEYIKYQKNNAIMDITKEIHDLIIFNSGLFIININVNIPELNELITKLKLIRGKLLGMPRYKIERQLDEKRENQDILMRKNYISSQDNKVLLKKYNYTLSIISDHLIVGYPDTVDPETHLPYFNCTCLSAESDGYLISKRSISLINEESTVIHNLKDYCLMKIEYNLNRLQQFKKEAKKYEISTPKQENKSINISENNIMERAFSETKINKNELNNSDENDNFHIDRNQIVKKKSKNNNKMLLSLKFNSNIIETLNNYNFNNEEIMNSKEKERKKSLNSPGNIYLKSRNKFNIIKNNNDINSKTYIIRKLRESILRKQKKIELKKEQYFKILDDLNKNKKEKMQKKLENSMSMKINEMKELQILFNNNKLKNNNNYEYFNNRIQNSMSQDNYLPHNNDSNSNKDNLLTLPSIEKNNNDKNKYNSRVNLKTESNPLLKDMKLNRNKKFIKKSDYISVDDIYKKNALSPSLLKEKYIIFKSPNKQVRENYITLNNDFQSKIKSFAPIRLKKESNKNSDILNYLDNNSEKKIEYVNIVSFNESQNQKNMDNINNMKEKYKELSKLVKSLQKNTSKILDKKE